MRRSTGAIIFVITAGLLSIIYYEFPAFRNFIFEYAAFLTFFGVLVAIFSLWYSSKGKGAPSKEKFPKERIKKK
jgi:membrane protease YdiL (CAAX protease family)